MVLRTATKYTKIVYNIYIIYIYIPKYTKIPRHSKICPNGDFWSEKIPSGNTDLVTSPGFHTDREWKEDELPPVEQPWSAKEVSERVNLLQKIAVNLRSPFYESLILQISF
jgi:hypothetical protein